MNFFRVERNFYQWSKKGFSLKDLRENGKRDFTCSAELKREKLRVNVGFGVEVATMGLTKEPLL